MKHFQFGYREVVPDQTLPEKWKEITLNTGGSQSTLQDIKVPERAGGYAYNDSSKHYTRNRFIYWRISHDILELVEQSLDVNLTNCRIRYKFVDTPILDGISIHETNDSVIILVVTVYSIYKLTFPHPDKIHRQEYLLSSPSSSSIFGEISSENTKEPHIFHVIPNAGNTNSPVPHAAASWLVLPQEEALFALAYSSGTILLLRLDATTNVVHSTELKQDSFVPRFLSGIATAFRGRNTEAHVPMALVIHAGSNDTYLFALCREGNVRMWSCNRAQCIAVSDIVADNNMASHGAQGHILRKAVGKHDDELYLATYMKFGSDCEFNILKPVSDQANIRFEKLGSLYVRDQHLVDFSFTEERLWAVWRTIDMDSVHVTYAQLTVEERQLKQTQWESVVLEQPPDKDYIASDPGIDPRQAYINYIFHPGQFSLSDITRALSIYRRLNVIADMSLSPAVLKEKVCAAVEAEIQTEVMDYELMDDDYLEIANRCWSKFYSCVVQYHANGAKPVGLLLLPGVAGVALLKKSTFSLLRPMQALEHLMLANHQNHSSKFQDTPILNEDEDICQDVVKLMSAVVMLEEQMPEEMKAAIEKELYKLNSPDKVVEDMMPKLSTDSDDPIWDKQFQAVLMENLSNIKNISSAIAMLLRLLVDFNVEFNKNDMEVEYSTSKDFVNISHLFSSHIGVSTIAESVAQIVILRFTICRNLLFILQMLLSDTANVEESKSRQMKSVWLPRTVVLTQAYYAIMWICESTASCAPTQALLENSSQRLALLNLSESRANYGQRQQRSLSLIELFIQTAGSKYIHKLMVQPNFESSNLELWHNGMLRNVMFVIQLIWPISTNFVFPEWLLSSCQFLLVQEYARLLSGTWCIWNSASRQFILAVALLEMGESQKAMEHFIGAVKGVLSDPFIANICLKDDVKCDEKSTLIKYYLKVIELLSQHNAADCVIEVAETAIKESVKDDPNLPTLYSIVFAQHLNLGHHNEAYNYLHLNPDAERRIDCLRQLIVTLFEKKKYTDLVTFPHTDMFEDLVRIVEARARSVDIMENHYYDFLYSFHVAKENWRKAASAKYEQALRFSQESHSVPIIVRQSQCLMHCINVLSLVNDKYRWIVRPTMMENYPDERDPKVKRSLDGKEIQHYKVKKQIEVLELADIKKEFAIVQAKLKLSKRNSELHTVAHAGPAELISMMSNVNLYTDALTLCDKFSLPKNIVLEHLASQCVRLSHQDDPQAWDWLLLNDVSGLNSAATNVATIAWTLLEKLTLKHEEKMSTDLHKAVAKKLIDHGAFFPQWLLTSYKKRNAAELLRLLLNVGRIAEATDLAEEYIMALLGKGMENFNLTSPLLSRGPPVWLPINTIEKLLLELECASKNDDTYIEYYSKLHESLENYIDTVERVSENMVKMKLKSY